MKDTYATAVLELLNEGTPLDTVFSNLKIVTESRGHKALLPAVLTALLSKYEQSERDNQPTVMVSNHKDATKNEVLVALKRLGAENSTPKVVLDNTVIGGAIVTYNHKMIDQSYKTQLHNLYKATTKG